MPMAFQPHSFMFQPHEEDHPHHHHHHHHDHDHHTNNASNPNSLFHGSGTQAPAFMMMKRSVSFDHHHQDQQVALSMQQHGSAVEDDLSDDGSQIGERKKRLNLEQVKTLEKSFEMGNKLEPERKLQLAKALGLQPRQVAIWFQNRRARWKTKQLEKEYDVLRKQFDALKADNDSLHAHNKKLHAELSALKGRDYSSENHKKDQGDQGSWSNGSDQNSSDINLDISRTPINNNVNNNNNTSNSSASSHQLAVHGKNLFPSSLIRPSSITQLLQAGNPRPSDLQCLKVDHPHHHQMLQSDETFCNMFVNGNATAAASAAVEADQPPPAGFWPWPEQHYFH